jgi:aryl-alcohol dehydrogenase-like predicted oxidoreductase
MEYRRLGKTDIEVSEISFGCWTMGGLNWVNGEPNGWADVNEGEIAAGIKAGLDAGVNHFDNADVYGNGRAERMLRRCLDRLGVRSTDVVIATKVGWFPGTAEHAFEPAHVRHQCEQSLVDLNREYIDLYYFHHADFGPDDRYLDEAVGVMNSLVAQGKVRFKGQSAYSADDFERVVPKVQPHVLQTSANALGDEFIKPGSRLQRLMEKEGLALVAFSPLAQGLLLDKFDPDNPPQFEPGDHRRGSERFSAGSLRALRPKLAKLKGRFGAATEDLAAMALNFVLAHPHVACVIPGFRNERQARSNVSAAGRKLSQEEVEFIRATLA